MSLGDLMDIKSRISHLFQLQEIENIGLKKITEIGIGDGHLSGYLKALDYDVTTVDYDKNLKPDIVADVRDYKFPNTDTTAMFEILEHIQYKEALEVLERASKKSKYVIISVPQGRLYFDISITFSGVKRFLGKHILSLHLNIPLRSKAIGNHKWELNRGVSLRSFKEELRKNYEIVNDYKIPLNSYHRIFVLRCKK